MAASGQHTGARAAHPPADRELPESDETLTCSPGLRHIGTGIEHRKCSRPPLEASIEFRQTITDEVARRFRDVARNPRGLVRKSVPFETERDDAVVVRPDGTSLIRNRVVGGNALR